MVDPNNALEQLQAAAKACIDKEIERIRRDRAREEELAEARHQAALARLEGLTMSLQSLKRDIDAAIGNAERSKRLQWSDLPKSTQAAFQKALAAAAKPRKRAA